MVLLVVIANTINIGADIGAVAAAGQLVVNLPFWLLAVVTAISVLLLEVLVTYKVYSRFLKWLALALLAYPATALIVPQPWGKIMLATVVPHIELSFAFLSSLEYLGHRFHHICFSGKHPKRLKKNSIKTYQHPGPIGENDCASSSAR